MACLTLGVLLTITAGLTFLYQPAIPNLFQASEPISYGRTVARHITKEKGFLSYPSSAIVTVYSKQNYQDSNPAEFWESEIQGKRGLIHQTAINELTFKCQPKEFPTEKELNDQLPPQGVEEAPTPGHGGSDPSDVPGNAETVPLHQDSQSATDEKEEDLHQPSGVHLEPSLVPERGDLPEKSSTPEVHFQEDTQPPSQYDSSAKDEERVGNIAKPDVELSPTSTISQDIPTAPTQFDDPTMFVDTSLLSQSLSSVLGNTLEAHTTDPIPTPESTDQPTPVPEAMDERKPTFVPQDGRAFTVDSNADSFAQMQGNLAQEEVQETTNQEGDGMPSSSTPPQNQSPDQFETQTMAAKDDITATIETPPPTETPSASPPPPPVQQEEQPVKKSDGGPGWRSYDEAEEDSEDEFEYREGREEDDEDWDDYEDEEEGDDGDKDFHGEDVEPRGNIEGLEGVEELKKEDKSFEIRQEKKEQDGEVTGGLSQDGDLRPTEETARSPPSTEEDVPTLQETSAGSSQEDSPNIEEQQLYHKQEDNDHVQPVEPETAPRDEPAFVPPPVVPTIATPEAFETLGHFDVPTPDLLASPSPPPPSSDTQGEFDATPHNHDRGYGLDAVKKRLELAKERSRQHRHHEPVENLETEDERQERSPPDDDPTPEERVAQPVTPTPEVEAQSFEESVQQPPTDEEAVRRDSGETQAYEEHSEPPVAQIEVANKAPEESHSTPPFEDTPPTETAADSEIPPPPISYYHPAYSCRDEYIPLPGSDSGWLAIHETFRAQARNWVFATLPEPWSEWICTNRPMLGVVMTSVIFTSMIVPLLFLLCQTCRSNRKKSLNVLYEIGQRRKIEESVLTLRAENSNMETSIRETKDACQRLQDDIRLQAQDRDTLSKEKRELEIHCQTLNNSLTTFQQQVTQQETHTQELNTEINLLEGQFAAVVTEKDTAFQQINHLSGVLDEQTQRVQGLEAQRDQLEQDKYSTQAALEELQSQHESVCKELDETKAKCAQTESELHSKTLDLRSKEETLAEREDELQSLRNCLHQVMEQASDVVPSGEEGVDAPSADTKVKPSQLAKIQAMLDTTKVQTELRETTEERDSLLSQLSEKTTQLEHENAENVRLNETVISLESKLQVTTKELDELQIKMKGVTEYFQEKEHTLHAKLEAGEQKRLKFENQESEAHEKAAHAEQERQKDRLELNELRDQMKEIERSYINQVKNNEQRAEDAISQLRRTEQDLRQANREITALKRRLADMDSVPPAMMRPIPHGPSYPPQQRTRPPSTDPQQTPGPPPVQPPRPVSAPRLEPRTSSPTVDGSTPSSGGPVMHPPHRPHPATTVGAPQHPPPPTMGPGRMPKSNSVTSMLNTSHPGPARPRTDLPPRPRSRGAADQPQGNLPHPPSMRTTPLGTAGPQTTKQLPPPTSTTPQHMQQGFRPPVRPTRPMYPPPHGSRLPPSSQGPRPPPPLGPRSRIPPPRMGGPGRPPPVGPQGPGYYPGGPPPAPRRELPQPQHQGGPPPRQGPPYQPDERGNMQGPGGSKNQRGEQTSQQTIKSPSPVLHETTASPDLSSSSCSSMSDSSPPLTPPKSCLKIFPCVPKKKVSFQVTSIPLAGAARNNLKNPSDPTAV